MEEGCVGNRNVPGQDASHRQPLTGRAADELTREYIESRKTQPDNKLEGSR